LSSSLLARFAGNAFWLARYVERAENLARILDINETYAREGHGAPDWRRILDLYADADRFMAAHERADTDSVLYFYVLDPGNPSSIRSAIDMAREDARSIRHLISTEMWTHLNMLRSRVMGLTGRDIKLRQLSRVCQEIRLDCQTFEGVAEGTFFRGPAWSFYTIGKYIERADQTTRVLDMGYGRLVGEESPDGAVSTVQWNVLLRSVAGYHAFRSHRPSGVEPQDIAMFLLYDRGFPRAVGLCVDRVAALLSDLGARDGRRSHADLEAALNQLVFTLNTGPGSSITRKRLNTFLDDLQLALIELSSQIGRAYFGAA